MSRPDGKLQGKTIHWSVWARRVLLLVVGLILGLNIYHWNAVSLAGNTLPMPMGTGVAVVLSGSMSPALETDDLIVVRKRLQYAVGDIVVYQSDTELIAHRIIARDGDRIITQGDANNVADAPVDISAVKGAVALRIPRLGALAKLLKLSAVQMLLLLGAGILLESSFQTEKRQREEELDEILAEISRLKVELAEEQAEPEKEDPAKNDSEKNDLEKR